MSARLATAALALVTLALAFVSAGCMPAPSGNEVNLSDEGMKNGAAASRGLTPVTLEEVELGKSINADYTIKDETDSFQPNDTIYAAISVGGSANSGLVRAVWTSDQGEPVQDDTRVVSPSRGDLVSVQLARPQGLAGGRYRVDIFLDNRLVETMTFSVEGSEAERQGAQAPNPTDH